MILTNFVACSSKQCLPKPVKLLGICGFNGHVTIAKATLPTASKQILEIIGEDLWTPSFAT